MISGIGIDVVEKARFESALSRYGARFLRRVFTAEEISYCEGKPKPLQHFAGRFAAKEAVAKALERRGEGVFRFCDIEVRATSDGRPTIRLWGLPAVWAEHAGVAKVHVSISHHEAYAVAVAVAETHGRAEPAPPIVQRA